MQNNFKLTNWYSKKGRPLTDPILVEKLLRDPKYKIVARSENRRYLVSTVWIGLNHNWNPCDEKLIFETMVFRKIPTIKDLFECYIVPLKSLLKFRIPSFYIHGLFSRSVLQERYETEQEALEGHDRILKSFIK